MKIAAFRRLLLADCLNLAGDWAGELALAILVFAKTGSALAVAMLLLASKALPALLSPLLVARLEASLQAHRGLALLYGCEVAVFATLALLAQHFSLGWVIALAAVDGLLGLSAGALWRSACAGLLVRRDALREGNALVNVVFTAAMAVGPALAGLAIALAGLPGALLIDAATFLAAGLLVISTPQLGEAAAEQEEGWLERLRGGFSFLGRERAALVLIVGFAVMTLFIDLVAPVDIVFAKGVLRATDTGYGFYLAAWGLGGVAGALLFAARPRINLYALVFLGGIGIGISYLGTALSQTLLAASALSVAGGLGVGVQWVAVTTVIQEQTPLALQARVIAIQNALAIAFVPALAYLLGGAGGEAFSPRLVFAVAGAGVLTSTLVVAWLLSGSFTADAPSRTGPAPAGGRRPRRSPLGRLRLRPDARAAAARSESA